MIRLREQIRNWYQGKYVPHTNDPNSSLVFTGGNYEKSLSAKTVTVLVKFWLQYWQWIISMFFRRDGNYYSSIGTSEKTR
jgi:hypothetical protein